MIVNTVLLLVLVLSFGHVLAHPTSRALLSVRSVRNNTTGSSNQQYEQLSLFHPDPGTYTAILWSSIGLAVLTAFLQGLVTAIASMTESSSQWTFRFRLAEVEFLWWTVVSGLLFTSLVLDILTFIAGNSNEATSILLLATGTLLSVVRYMIPAWRSRKYIRNRALAWAGPSRTSISRNHISYARSETEWKKLRSKTKLGQRKPIPSDEWGWHVFPVKGIREDPTEILNNISPQHINILTGSIEFVYEDGDPESKRASLYWGSHNGFLPRVSRSISAVPHSLLQSQPFTSDGYAGEGFCLGMGILGRNKGLAPARLVFDTTKDLSTTLEDTSTWRPRPAKTLRSYYHRYLDDIYHGLGKPFVNAAVELCLLLLDVDDPAIATWLIAGCDQQSYKINKALQDASATIDELKAHYESSYVSMIMSLNYVKDDKLGRSNHETSLAIRPDLICTGLLLLHRGLPEPRWWNTNTFRSYREAEKGHLDPAFYGPAARLLGLEAFPPGFENGDWPTVNAAGVCNNPSSVDTIVTKESGDRDKTE